MGLIALFTDFGLEGPYIGQVQARLLKQAPDVPVISLFADLAPFDVQAAAYLLPAYAHNFPDGTVFLCVVDPGVGGSRHAVAVRAGEHWFVGPNEGLFALVARRAHEVACFELPHVAGAAPSFHGRDIFAPAAARLACGEWPEGQRVDGSVLEQPDWPDDLYRVVYIDRYGNAVTGVRAERVDSTQILTVNGYTLRPASTFSDVAAGEAFWYANANGLVELAVNRGRADEVLGLSIGSAVSVQGNDR